MTTPVLPHFTVPTPGLPPAQAHLRKIFAILWEERGEGSPTEAQFDRIYYPAVNYIVESPIDLACRRWIHSTS